MTCYQRGSRDGLLNAAAQIEAEAAVYEARASKIKNPTSGGAAESLMLADYSRADSLRSAAARCRRLAEALPDDPEEWT